MGEATEAELATLVLGLGVAFVAALRASTIRRVFRWQILVASYVALLLGWTATCLEALGERLALNFVEHAAYAASALLAVAWCVLHPRGLRDQR